MRSTENQSTSLKRLAKNSFLAFVSINVLNILGRNNPNHTVSWNRELKIWSSNFGEGWNASEEGHQCIYETTSWWRDSAPHV